MTITHVISTQYGWYIHGTLRNQTQAPFSVNQIRLQHAGLTKGQSISLRFYPHKLTIKPNNQPSHWTTLIPLKNKESISSKGEILIQSTDDRTLHISLLNLLKL